MPYMNKLNSVTSRPKNAEKGRLMFLENSKINGVIAVGEYIGGVSGNILDEIKYYQEMSTPDYPIHSSYLINYQHVSNTNANDNQATYDEMMSYMEKYDTDKFKVMKALKFFFDGAVIDHQIMLSEPLKDGYVGEWNYDFNGHNMKTFVGDMIDYWKQGFDFYVHSQGDSSQLAIAHFVKELQELHTREDYIASIQHFAFSNDEFFKFVNDNNLHMQISALPLYLDVWSMWEKADLYPEKFLQQEFLRLKDVQDSENFSLSFHSDASNNPTTPLYGVYKAVTRKDISDEPIKDKTNQKIDVVTGLKAITIEAAKQNRNEAIMGSLGPGKQASFVVFDKDFVEGTSEDLRQSVSNLVMDGRVIF
ncbi:amidohydrolase family protein [Vagococcus fessus]|uniref:Amidohydrolase 3 domain-containing protein n=1 Tax=Vagococcus fessus TaxID=120370 RepID=A0A430A6B3_9ENTE|nr:amidohydrolase family protein [Vagococcus fessus]RSU02437.1 hypothetical protein CBF31_08695 [Vagococcus fessus]